MTATLMLGLGRAGSIPPVKGLQPQSGTMTTKHDADCPGVSNVEFEPFPFSISLRKLESPRARPFHAVERLIGFEQRALRISESVP